MGETEAGVKVQPPAAPQPPPCGCGTRCLQGRALSWGFSGSLGSGAFLWHLHLTARLQSRLSSEYGVGVGVGRSEGGGWWRGQVPWMGPVLNLGRCYTPRNCSQLVFSELVSCHPDTPPPRRGLMGLNSRPPRLKDSVNPLPVWPPRDQGQQH